jgi:protein-tyrosine phosphatase
MVCLGNICRSPMADGLLRKKVAEASLPVIVDSAGTSGFHEGDAPDARMIQTAKNRGVDISFLRSRPFLDTDADTFDIIYAMDEQNLRDMRQKVASEEMKRKIRLILDEIPSSTITNVPDPYYGGQDGFDLVFNLLDKATDIIIEKIQKGELR